MIEDRLAILFQAVEEHISIMSEHIGFEDFDSAAILIQECYLAQSRLAELNAMLATNTMRALCKPDTPSKI